MLEYLFIAFLVIFCIQFYFYTFFYTPFVFKKQLIQKNSFTNPVSIIICAKNEAKNLLKNIPLFINQNYPKFELVLVNDCSRDATLKIFKKFKELHPSLIKIVDVKENEQFWGSKKYALTLGIKAATYEHLLFSDADCKPVTENWISEMATSFSNEKQLILGFGKYETIQKSFLNKLIRFETLLTALNYFSFANIGIPYMGVGRNLAYTKSLFYQANGFVAHMKIKSGDDDLFVNQIASKKNTNICISADSFTESKPKNTLKAWIHQKRRHISTSSHYKTNHKILLSVLYGSNLLLWLTGIILFIFWFQWKIVAILLTVKLIYQTIIYFKTTKIFNEKKIIGIFPVLEIFLICIQLFIFIKNLISKPTNW